MIQFQNVVKFYGDQDVLRDASFQINPGERVGIVGPNGAGKSTIFRLVVGEEHCEAGEITVPKALSIGYLKQQIPDQDGHIALRDFAMQGVAAVLALEEEWHQLQEKLPNIAAEERPGVLDRIGDLQHRFEDEGGYTARSRTEAALSGLGFAADAFERPLSTFSGGWQMRAMLARTLIANPDILLLDEPSNYLDLPAVEWLQRFLVGYAGTLLLISHDRFLLESLAREILEVRHARVTRYAGSFSFYEKERVERYARREAELKSLQRRRDELERFVERFRAKATKAAQAQSRMKQLEKMDPIEELDSMATLQLIRIPPPPHSGQELMRLEGVGFRYSEDSPWLFRNLDLSLERGDCFAVVGYNGMGKTTLLKLLAGVNLPNEGRRVPGHQVVVGYQSQEFADTMPPDQSAYSVIRDAAPGDMSEQEIRRLLGGFGFSGEAIEKPTDVLSGGEKIRLAFARIFVNPPNLLILDEPTTHLDIEGCEALEEAIAQYEGTVCLVSHDITFVRKVAKQILAVTPKGLKRFHGDYAYFEEKSGGLQAVCGALSDSTPVPKPTKSVLSGKERKDLQRKIRVLERKMEACEAELEKLEQAQNEGVQKMNQGGDVDFSALNQELETIAGKIREQNEVWEKAGLELEALNEGL